MKTFLKILGVLVVLMVLTILGLSAYGAHQFRGLYGEEKAELLLKGTSAPTPVLDEKAVKALPEPVRRYLGIVSAKGEPAVRTAVLRQTGAIRSSPEGPWMPFEAEQSYALSPPGFLWLAQARMAPLVDFWARDKYVDGQGHMFVRLLGLFKVADARGPDIDRGAALRFLGEIMMFPSAVTAPYVGWRAIDPQHAGLFIRLGDELVDGIVDFDAEGRLSAFHARRPMDVGGKSEEHPWTGTMSGWKEVDGRLIPTHWEATWHLPNAEFTYVKIDVTSVATE
jgi:hypothetical protein